MKHKIGIGDLVIIAAQTKHWENKPFKNKLEEIGSIGEVVSLFEDNTMSVQAHLTYNDDIGHESQRCWRFDVKDLILLEKNA